MHQERKKVFSQLMEEAGGYENVRNFGDHPRNRDQISNLRKKPNTDEIVDILDLCKQQETEPDTAFVRDITLAPEKTVFLANKQQLQDLDRFCTDPHSFCVLGVDPTYNIGNFYVTVSTYRHLQLLTKKGAHPVMIGPVLIHYKKGFDSYFQLPSNMIRFHRPLINIKCFGTDGEVNVSDALKAVFTDGQHLMCDIHMRDNVISKLQELGIPPETKKQIVNDIFGNISGSIKVKVLIAGTLMSWIRTLSQ